MGKGIYNYKRIIRDCKKIFIKTEKNCENCGVALRPARLDYVNYFLVTAIVIVSIIL